LFARLCTLVLLTLFGDAPVFAQAAGRGDPAKAAPIADSLCAPCHGPRGYSPLASNPHLAGLQSQYLARQLVDYKEGRRKHDIMSPTAASLSAEDIDNLAAFFSRQPPAPGVVNDRSLLDLGKKVFLDGNVDSGVPSCSGCHYPDGKGTARFPRLAGQHATYIVQQLKDYASARRDNDRSKVMNSLAARMTEQEMRAVAEYIAGLP
jgi:cytochrome c553